MLFAYVMKAKLCLEFIESKALGTNYSKAVIYNTHCTQLT